MKANFKWSFNWYCNYLGSLVRDQQESFGVASKLPYHQETIRSSEETRGTLDEGFDQFKQL